MQGSIEAMGTFRPPPWLHTALLLAALFLAACGEERPRPIDSPGEPAWQMALAEVVRRAGRPEPLEEYVTEAQRDAMAGARNLQQRLDLKPNDQKTRLELASIYAANLAPERALQALGTILAAEPDNPDALALAAACLLELQDLEGAGALANRTLALAPRNSGARRVLTQVLERQGQYEEAAQIAREGLQHDPFNGAWKLVLARSAFEGGRTDEAAELLDQAVRDQPGSLEVHYLRAIVLEDLGRSEEAAQARKTHARLAQIDDLGLPPGTPDLQVHLALIQHLRQSGALEQAEAEAQELAQRTGHPQAQQALEEIQAQRSQ